ncbi:hypothetical protein D9611_012683 [Ephemerocybe angulata]|uniref:Uncharacterized protein n=1 Tax=Ephemerocybe angulata TaxID=980116 RepID=A0A8H5B991_9AGAR|nr:hypothetical protein D9611_012683 [Tulosesus angulatus]
MMGSPEDKERRDERRDETSQRLMVTKAREVIYKDGYAVDNDTHVEKILKPTSLNVVENGFSNVLESYSFDLIPTIVVDLMHEFEIGVWKRLFIHLLRLLDAFTVTRTGPTLTAELDARFRSIPSFGRDGIRKFGKNASGMKRRAARDFEDLLQCSITAFESLLPEPHNTSLMKLLYICAQWHALAKLRLHNDLTLNLLDYTTTLLGAQMRAFDQDTCAKVPTLELKKEAEARARKEGSASKSSVGSTSRRPASLDMYTIKFHYLGDYVASIRHFGTTDSYTTEIGELCHRLPKQWYPRTDRREYEGQMAQIERRQARLARIRAELEARRIAESSDGGESPLPEPSLDVDYRVGQGSDEIFDLHRMFMMTPGEPQNDLYLHNFMPKLKQYLLPLVVEYLGFDPEESNDFAWESISIQGDRLYHHKIMRTDYTTYDLRRSEDITHVDTPQSNVMLLNAAYSANSQGAQPEHPYRYAKVLVQFIEPADVLRAVHIVPRFSQGKVEEPEVKSRWINNDTHPWNEYCLNKFADRDLFMRYQYGMSVGHTYMYSGTFPPPKVPEIPPTFDHRTSRPTTASSSTTTATPIEAAPQASGSAAEVERGPTSQVDAELDGPGYDNEGGPLEDEGYIEDLDDHEAAQEDTLYGDVI